MSSGGAGGCAGRAAFEVYYRGWLARERSHPPTPPELLTGEGRRLYIRGYHDRRIAGEQGYVGAGAPTRFDSKRLTALDV